MATFGEVGERHVGILCINFYAYLILKLFQKKTKFLYMGPHSSFFNYLVSCLQIMLCFI